MHCLRGHPRLQKLISFSVTATVRWLKTPSTNALLIDLVFDAPDSKSSRYNVELELENEDSDWSFEVTVTVEF